MRYASGIAKKGEYQFSPTPICCHSQLAGCVIIRFKLGSHLPFIYKSGCFLLYSDNPIYLSKLTTFHYYSRLICLSIDTFSHPTAYPFNVDIIFLFPSIVIILAILKQVDNKDISAFTPAKPLSKNEPAFKLLFIWPNGNSTLHLRFL